MQGGTGGVGTLPSPSNTGATTSRQRQPMGGPALHCIEGEGEGGHPLASAARAEDAGASRCGIWVIVNSKGRQRVLENNCEILK